MSMEYQKIINLLDSTTNPNIEQNKEQKYI